MNQSWRVLVGDVIDGLRSLPDESVHCVVTSPPYWGLRDYGAEGMIGLEPTLAEHMAKLVEVFREVRRVLRSDGVCWVNYGDAYAGGGDRARTKCDSSGGIGTNPMRGSQKQGSASCGIAAAPQHESLPPKQRLLLPARVAIALQEDGWWVRSEIVWAKGVSFCPTYSGSCMPSSVRDRPTDSHEMVYLLSKSPRYFYDGDAVREENADPSIIGARIGGCYPSGADEGVKKEWGGVVLPGRNIRTVWTINPKGYKEAHFATYPESLVEPCIKAGTSEHGACGECGAPWERVVETQRAGETLANPRKLNELVDMGIRSGGKESRRLGPGVADSRTTSGWRPTCSHPGAPLVPCTVLDPFSGSGTTGAVAVRLGRSYVGTEINPEYARLSRIRIGRAAAEAGIASGDVTAAEDEQASQLGLFGAA